jgi:hypothetical protein
MPSIWVSIIVLRLWINVTIVPSLFHSLRWKRRMGDLGTIINKWKGHGMMLLWRILRCRFGLHLVSIRKTEDDINGDWRKIPNWVSVTYDPSGFTTSNWLSVISLLIRSKYQACNIGPKVPSSTHIPNMFTYQCYKHFMFPPFMLCAQPSVTSSILLLWQILCEEFKEFMIFPYIERPHSRRE